MKKRTGSIWLIFGMRLVLTCISAILLRWGVVEKDLPASAGAVEEQKIENIDWVGKLKVASKTNQVIIVQVEGTQAVLTMYTNEDGKWKSYIETECYIGKKGIGKVREGDGKTPIGEYKFTHAFGILENPGTDLFYTKVDETHYWVDDAKSTYYNQFVSLESVKMDWESAEHIIEHAPSYNYVLAINYNQNCEAGAGSAIFLHCVSEKSKATNGCIAVLECAMKEILREIDADCVLIIDTKEGVKKY